MGHDTHFLSRLTRVSDADVELAMSLYRDVPLVRDVVEAAPVPEDVTRVAIALDASDAPPLVLVERSGKFVTCLAPGMKTDLPIISRAALDRALRVKQNKDRVRAMLDQYEADKQKPTRLSRGESVDLESMEFLLAAAPLTVHRTLERMRSRACESSATLMTLVRKEKVRPRDEPLLQKVLTSGWIGAHQAVPLAVGLRGQIELPEILDVFLASAQLLSITQFLPWTLRVVWACAYLGKPMLPVIKECLPRTSRPQPACFLILGAMALGHRKLESEIRKLLERHKGNLDCQAVLDVLDEPERYTPVCLELARRMGVRITEHLPDGHPARYHSGDEVPAEFTLALLARWPFGRHEEVTWTALLGALPLLARARAEDFYVPSAVLKHWATSGGVDGIRRLVELEIPVNRRPETRADPTPGRNEPCPCGSGRKFKKCCA